ncbi:N-acetyl-gamma-glutamyl-phosphate reductase [bacterium]|nr:N-acetyl-gamma-glutamyl-phosphate reductase [bacterium]
MIRVGILGASGYTGARLAYYFSRHPQVKIVYVTSRSEKGKALSDLYGNLRGLCDVPFSDPADVKDTVIDLLFACAPDQTSMSVVPEFYDRGVAVIDLAGDYRMDTAESYERWYGKPHVSPQYIEKRVFGLTELYRDRVKAAKLVSNPGCYPTSVILGLAPLLREGIIDCSGIHVNSVSGISGAGREFKPFKLFYEADSNVMPYALGRRHKHVGEMEQELTKIAGEVCTVTFAPHVVPMKTGIVSTILAKLRKPVTKKDLDDLYREAYDSEFFVRYYSDRIPESKFVADTNFCDIGLNLAEGTDRIIVVSTICNLGKGASGQAVQNMNVMFGFDEKEGLL